MATQYTSTLKLALPVTGELSGTWGDVVNENITSMVEQAVAGLASINTWTTNSHTLTVANGTTSESRCAMLVLTDTGTALTGAATVVCPTASKIYIVKNTSGQTATIKTAAGTGVAIADDKTAFVFCDGTNVVEAVTTITGASLGFTSLTGTGAVVVTNILDEDNMASDSATALATQQSIKAYVDSQIAANNDLSEVLANGNTTGGTDIVVSAGDDVTFTDTSKAIFGAGGDLEVYHDGTNSYIRDAGTGSLVVQTTGLVVQNAAGNETLLSATENGATVLYNDNVARVTTSGTGVDIAGNLTATGTARIGQLNTDTSLTTHGTGSLTLNTNGGTNSGTISIGQGVNGTIALTPNGTGAVSITGAFSLTGDQVQVTEGGTGATTAGGARTNLGLGTIATQDSSSVSLTGGSITGITDLAIADGGTAASTANAGFNNLAPAQTGNTGKYLSTDGTDTSWAAVDALPSQTGNNGKYLTTDGSAASWGVLDTDANTTTKGLYEMANTISVDYTIGTGNNAMSAGPITIDSGVSVTVPTGSRWVVI